jgi:hypothetical protein
MRLRQNTLGHVPTPAPQRLTSARRATVPALPWEPNRIAGRADKEPPVTLVPTRKLPGGMSRPCRWRCRRAHSDRTSGSGEIQAARRTLKASSHRGRTRPGRASSVREPRPERRARPMESPPRPTNRLRRCVGLRGSRASRVRASTHCPRGEEASRPPNTTRRPWSLDRSSWTSPPGSRGLVADPPRSPAISSPRSLVRPLSLTSIPMVTRMHPPSRVRPKQEKWTCGIRRRVPVAWMFHVKHLQVVVKGWSQNSRTRPSRTKRR